MKRLVFVLILIIVLLQTGIISANSEHISDWAKDEVNEAISLGFIPEKLQNNYNENITREEFVTVAVEYMSYQFDMSVEKMADRCKSTDDYFSDIEGSEFADYIRLAKRLGIIKETVTVHSVLAHKSQERRPSLFLPTFLCVIQPGGKWVTTTSHNLMIWTKCHIGRGALLEWYTGWVL